MLRVGHVAKQKLECKLGFHIRNWTDFLARFQACRHLFGDGGESS